MTRQTPPDLYGWHRYYALDDPEFVQSAKAIRAAITNKYGEKAQLGTGSISILDPKSGEAETKATFGITYPNYKAKELGDEDICAAILDLSHDFSLELHDVAFFINGFYVKYEPTGNSRVSVGMDKESVFVRISPRASKDDFINSWPDIEVFQSLLWDDHKPTKNKLPLETDLIYAVFRARRKGMPFSKIFRLYQDGKLPKYEHSTGQFNSADSLARYYRKYQPDT